MNILLHVCCGPCTIHPLSTLRAEGHDLTGLFYNPNIHPSLEYGKRYDTLQGYADRQNLFLVSHDDYPMEDFLRRVAFREHERCRVCYAMRLAYTVQKAREGRFEGFTTTLLYSKYQNHALIKEIGETLADEYGVAFVYRDFRTGWDEGVGLSREMGMYRQPYCGCIYSEKERYAATPLRTAKHRKAAGAVLG